MQRRSGARCTLRLGIDERRAVRTPWERERAGIGLGKDLFNPVQPPLASDHLRKRIRRPCCKFVGRHLDIRSPFENLSLISLSRFWGALQRRCGACLSRGAIVMAIAEIEGCQ
jgi:hypothetical protein